MDASLDFTIKTWDIAAAVAMCRESGIELLYLEDNPFPVRQFDVRMKSIPYLAARKEVLDKLKGRLPVP
jgi:fructose-1,6-bisphosphatase/inositol monophosphatase family enzyme